MLVRLKAWIQYQLRELCRGVRETSYFSLIATVVVMLAILASCVKFVTAKSIANLPTKYLMTSPEDEDALLTSRVLKINQHPSQNFSVVVMGDSSLREAITSEKDLQRRICEKTSFPVDVHLLVTGAMSLWDDVAVSDFIGGKVKGLILLEVSPPKLSVTAEGLSFRVEQPRYCFAASGSFDEEARRLGIQLPHHVNNFFIDNRQFFLARPAILWNIVTRHGHDPNLQHAHVRHWSKQDWDANDWRFQKWAQLYLENRYSNLAVYNRVLHRLMPGGSSPDVSVVLLEGVENPAGAAHEPYLAGEEHQQYLNDIETYAKQNNIQYWNLAAAAHLSGADFADYMHIDNNDARQRYTAAMADAAAAELLRQQAQQKANP